MVEWKNRHIVLRVVSICFVLVFGLPLCVHARNFRMGMIPNGNQFSCAVCHTDEAGGGRRNPFGKDVEARVTPRGREWFWAADLAALDSDGDGLVNGEELQDPGGNWRSGAPDPGDPTRVSNPGRVEGAAPEPPEPKEATDADGGPRLELDVSTSVRFDRDAEGSDWDSRFYTNMIIRDVIEDHLDIKLAGWGLWDMDANDAFDRALDRQPVRFSEAYLDFREVGPFHRLRLGRQYLYEVDNIRFDGATWWTKPRKKIAFFIFGGRPFTYYRSAAGNWLGGGGMVWRPSWRTKHQFDAYLLQDGGELLAPSAWRWNQYWGGHLRSTTRLRFLDSDVRDFRALVFKHFEHCDLNVSLNYYLQPEVRGRGDQSYSRSHSHYGYLLGSRAANHRIGFNLNKYFNEQRWLAQVGGSLRRRIGNSHDDTYNSIESSHGQVSLTRYRIFEKDLSLTLGVEGIHNEHDRMFAMTGLASYAPNPRWYCYAGASFSRFEFDPIDFPTDLHGQDDLDLLETSQRSLVYMLGARWEPNDSHTIRADVAWEDTDAFDGSGLSARLGYTYYLRRNLGRKENR